MYLHQVCELGKARDWRICDSHVVLGSEGVWVPDRDRDFAAGSQILQRLEIEIDALR